MSDSLIEELPKIVEKGNKEAQRMIDGLSKSQRVTLQTNELVLPTKAKGGLTTFGGQIVKESKINELINRLIYGDNLLAMQALLAGDPSTGLPPMRGKIDLIYIDPPFDSKADYRTKIHLPTTDIEQKPSVIEQFAYSDTWKNGTKSYLEMIVPRLILMKELLSEKGAIYVHIDSRVGHYVKVIMDAIFGKDKFKSEIIWKQTRAKSTGFKTYGLEHNSIFFIQNQTILYGICNIKTMMTISLIDTTAILSKKMAHIKSMEKTKWKNLGGQVNIHKVGNLHLYHYKDLWREIDQT
jgi:adenine specific DNA methylase Mod